jgi:uncharacterized protein (DUF1015 family)
MTDVRAFRGIRYNQTKVRLDDVTAPPYDIISQEQQRGYYEKSPFNIVRLDYGQILPDDSEQDNRYTRAATDFLAWQNQGILRKDEKPAIYVYRQNFVRDGRPTRVTGIISLVKLTEFGEDVLPHEKTLSGPKKDRRLLLESCEANFSQVYAMYSDRSGTVEEVLLKTTAEPPELETTDEDNVVHQVWPLTNQEDIRRIADILADRRLLIADGHHRYETSLNFAKDMRVAGKARPSFDYIMMFLVDMVHEDLIILPTHRVVKTADFDLQNLLGQAREVFEVSEGAWSPRSAEAAGAHDADVQFGLYADHRFFRLRANRGKLADSLPGANSTAWKRLDTTLLQETFLSRYLGITSGDPSLSFTQDIQEAIKRVNSGRADLAILLEPMLIDKVEAVAEAGDKMPQKSTYFYPKPRTGMVIRDLE